LVRLDCRGESDGDLRGTAEPDAELESVGHVGLEKIVDPSVEPLLQEVSSEVTIKTMFYIGLQYIIILCPEN
jgi:hypothetical protein